ncbi:hypothetical protein BH11MYX4_BH11MYX4_46850 [soil metagenome]
MSRTTTLFLTAVAILGTACARQAETSTTTVTSGSARASSADTDEASLRLADEICNREEACGQIGVGAHYRSLEACMSDQGSRSPARRARWSCAPSETPPGFEACLAAIRSERCESPLARIDELYACRSKAVCGR